MYILFEKSPPTPPSPAPLPGRTFSTLLFSDCVEEKTRKYSRSHMKNIAVFLI
jgi:hypothetical protein